MSTTTNYNNVNLANVGNLQVNNGIQSPGLGGFQTNTAIGNNALPLTQGAGNNTAVGASALSQNFSSNNGNTAVGSGALQAATATNNTAVGQGALGAVTTGTNNTAIGTSAGATGTNNLTTGTNVTLIGNAAQSPTANENNTIVLGNSSIAKIYAQVTTITALSSDARDKTDVETIPLGLDFINQLRPVKFKYDVRDRYENGIPDGSKADDFWTTGFIAQEVMNVQPDWFPMATVLGEDRLTACPGMVLMPLLKAVQELSAKVTALQAEVDLLKSRS